MRFYLFERQSDEHTRKSRDYLEEAHVRRVEHQAAAEHHGALAKMYENRITRIQAEMNAEFQARANNAPMEALPNESLRLKSDSVVSYPSRTAHG